DCKNLCEEGGSDLPGTKVALSEYIYGPDGKQLIAPPPIVLTLRDDTLAPTLHVVSTPERGSLVKAGDKITLDVNAKEEKSGPSWQTGVRRIWLEAKPEG